MQEYDTIENEAVAKTEKPTMEIPFVIPASVYNEVPEATMEIMNTILMLQGAAHNGSPFAVLTKPLKEAIGVDEESIGYSKEHSIVFSKNQKY